MNTRSMERTLLPKRIALPVFASDALSSVAYAPDEILLTLSLAGGLAVMNYSWWVGLAVVVVLATVVLSYRQTVHAYPSGGGDYEVVSANFGAGPGKIVASALLVDYVLTVAVSVSSGARYFTAAFTRFAGSEAMIALAVVGLLMLINLRGIREAGRAFAIPSYIYMASILTMAIFGLFQEWNGTLRVAETAQYTVVHAAEYENGLLGFAGFFLILRAFSSGCAALTGVETISNGVPAFRKPKSRNAATTLAMLGMLSAVMMLSILHLARATGVNLVEDPATQLLKDGAPLGHDIMMAPVIGQLAATIFADFRPLFYIATGITGLILVLAANTAFNGFPVLASVLSRDSFLPHQLGNRGDRLSFSNGIVVLAASAGILIFVFDAQVTRLIQLYIVGVFVSFTLSQIGMVRHWNRALATESSYQRRRQMQHSRVVNIIGSLMTGSVLAVVLVTKFMHGAWITLLLMGLLYLMMDLIHRHYQNTGRELEVSSMLRAKSLPTRVHGVILVSKLHKPAMRAISYARASNPSSLEIITVAVDSNEAAELRKQWLDLGVDIPLTIISSPFREVARPAVSYVHALRRRSPDDLVVVFIPEYLVKHWWQQALHNQTALRIKSRLLYEPGVVVASVPFQLGSQPAEPSATKTVDPVADGWARAKAASEIPPKEAEPPLDKPS